MCKPVHCSLLLTTWSQPFSKHFVYNIRPMVDRIGAWMLRLYGLESATSQGPCGEHVHQPVRSVQLRLETASGLKGGSDRHNVAESFLPLAV